MGRNWRGLHRAARRRDASRGGCAALLRRKACALQASRVRAVRRCHSAHRVRQDPTTEAARVARTTAELRRDCMTDTPPGNAEAIIGIERERGVAWVALN